MPVNKVAKSECPWLWHTRAKQMLQFTLRHRVAAHTGTPHTILPISLQKKTLHFRIQLKGNSVYYFLSLQPLGAHITCCCCESFCLLNVSLSIITDSNSERLSGWRTFWCSAGCFRMVECWKKFYDGRLLISKDDPLYFNSNNETT